MSCFIKLTQDLTELDHYDDVIKISEISNKILKNRVEHLYEEKILEATFGDSSFEFLPEKSNIYHFIWLNFLTKLQKEKE